MLAIVPKQGSTVDFSFVRSFRNLASCGMVGPHSSPGHGDGWGIVVWERGLPVYLGREPTDAYSDPKFVEACRKGESSRVRSPLIAHLRKASVGVKTIENTHPFVKGKWAFAHNGTIRKLNLRYTTDSEWFFASLEKEIGKQNGNVVSAVARQVGAVREVYPYTSITFLLSDGNSLYAYRDASSQEEYYTMYYAETSSAFLIMQEKITDAPWKSLDIGQLLKIDRASGKSEITNVNELPEISLRS